MILDHFFCFSNIFHVSDPFLYALKTSESLQFLCFQEVLKETSGMKWVDINFRNASQQIYSNSFGN